MRAAPRPGSETTGHAEAPCAAPAPRYVRQSHAARMAGAAAALVLLGGCAGPLVTGVTAASTGAPPPAAILVAVDVPPPGQGGPQALPAGVKAKLERSLEHELSRAGVATGPFAPGAVAPGTAVLHVSVIEADPGNPAARFVVGFGAGRAALVTRASLEDAAAPPSSAPLVTFETFTEDSSKPGLILPGAIAAATGRLVGLAVGGGVDVALNVKGGLDGNVGRTASAIIGQLRRYYASAGWPWPAGG